MYVINVAKLYHYPPLLPLWLHQSDAKTQILANERNKLLKKNSYKQNPSLVGKPLLKIPRS